MPMVRLYVNQANAHLVRDSVCKRELRNRIAAALSMAGNHLDPDDHIDVRVVVSAEGSHSKYDLTVDIEAMDTPERTEYHSVISRTIGLDAIQVFSNELTVNVWLKLEKAAYWPED